MTHPARKLALYLSAFAVATAAPLISAGTLLAATSAQQVYEQPETRTTQSQLPEIPQLAGDYVPPTGSSSETPPEVAGETPAENTPPSEVPPVVRPAETTPEAHAGDDTLPVTGLDVVIILAAAAAAGGVGFALRRGARTS